MNYFKLPVLNGLNADIRTAMNREINYRGEDNVLSSTIGFLTTPKTILDNYLKPYGFPPVHSCILFSRPAGVKQEIHVDCSSADDLELINCAVNFPIENCGDSNMFWYSGDYVTSTTEYTGKDNIKRKYVVLDWKSDPVILDQTIIDTPTLVRVNVPHRVETIPTHRKLLTFRFKGNPTYEEIACLFEKIDKA
jgi:hypothetical protein